QQLAQSISGTMSGQDGFVEPTSKGEESVARIKALFYLPLRDNDGRELTEEIESLEAEVFIRFSGWTFQGYVKGAYRMADGMQSLDESAAYVVVCDESRIDEL